MRWRMHTQIRPYNCDYLKPFLITKDFKDWELYLKSIAGRSSRFCKGTAHGLSTKSSTVVEVVCVPTSDAYRPNPTPYKCKWMKQLGMNQSWARLCNYSFFFFNFAPSWRHAGTCPEPQLFLVKADTVGGEFISGLCRVRLTGFLV